MSDVHANGARVAVTGATGFVGSILVRQLSQLGIPTLALVREETLIPGIECAVVGDLEQATGLASILKGTDCVVHLAGRAHVLKETVKDPLEAFTLANVDATVRLAEASAEAKVGRFIFVSTIKVHGESTSGAPFRPDDAPNPVGVYAQTKQIAESKLRSISSATGLQVVIIRPPLVYGPGVKGNFARLMKLVDKGFLLPLGGATNKRSMVSVFNLCDLIVKCIDHPQAQGSTFLVSDGVDLSTAELVRKLATAMNRRPRLVSAPVPVIKASMTLAGRGGDVRRLFDSLRVDIQETTEKLGWKPPYTVEEGLSRCLTG
jgi:nucleoside-diphosphate-sugar epimerase